MVMGGNISEQDRFWDAVRWADAAALRQALQDGADARQWQVPKGHALLQLGEEWLLRRGTNASLPTWYTTEDVDACVQMLLQAGLDPRGRDHHGRTVLHNSFLYIAASPQTLASLIEKGLDVNACDNGWATPAHACAYGGRAEMAEVLKKAGADFSARTANVYNEPIHMAATYGNTAMIDWLLSQGYSLFRPNGERVLAAEMWLCRQEGMVSLAQAVARVRAAGVPMGPADVSALAYGYHKLQYKEDAQAFLDVYREAMGGLDGLRQHELAWEVARGVVGFGASLGGLGHVVRELVRSLLEPLAPLGNDIEAAKFAVYALREHHRHSTTQMMRQLLVELLQLGWKPSQEVVQAMAEDLACKFEGTSSEADLQDIMAVLHVQLQADELLSLQEDESGVEVPR